MDSLIKTRHPFTAPTLADRLNLREYIEYGIHHCRTFLRKVVAFVLLVFTYLTGNSQMEKSTKAEETCPKSLDDMPGPLRLPFSGTSWTSTAMNENNIARACNTQEKLYGGVVRQETYFNHPIVFILDGQAIEETIMQVDTLRPPLAIIYAYRQANYDRFRSLGLVNENGPEWVKLSQAFTVKLKSSKHASEMIPVYNELATDFIFYLNDIHQKSEYLEDCVPIINDYVAEAAFLLMFGFKCGFVTKAGDRPDSKSKFAEIHDRYFGIFRASNVGFPWWAIFPTKTWKTFGAAEETLQEFAQEMMDEAIKENKVDGMLAVMLENESYDMIAKRTILAEVLAGATEPVLLTFLYTLYYISKDDRVQKKVHQELKNNMSSFESDVDIKNLPYLKACFNESLRYGPAPFSNARITSSETLIGGYKLPPNTILCFETWWACMQEENFYRATEFIPERWLAEEEEKYKPCRRNLVNAFGFGIRSCPGQRDATSKIQILLAKVLRQYWVKFPEDIEMIDSFLMIPLSRKIPLLLKKHDE